MFLSSDKVTVFPVVKRDSSYQVQSRLLTEQNLVSLVNRFSDVDSFIISPSYYTSSYTEIELNIHGYYFKLTDVSALKTGGSDVYAYIKIDLPYNIISDGDLDEEYHGIGFDSAIPSPAEGENAIYYGLKLFEYDGSTYHLCRDSYLRYNPSRLSVSSIDGGEI